MVIAFWSVVAGVVIGSLVLGRRRRRARVREIESGAMAVPGGTTDGLGRSSVGIETAVISAQGQGIVGPMSSNHP